MNYEEIKLLLEKYNWIIESYSPLNIRSIDGEHHATNFAAELVIEYFAMLEYNGNITESDDIKNRFKYES